VNPKGQPTGLLKHLVKSLPETIYYPDSQPKALLDKISDATELASKHLALGAGSSPQIYHLFRVLRPKHTVIIGPAFSEYAQAAAAFGGKYAYVTASSEKGFEVDEAVIDLAVKQKPDLVFVANPSNPTGLLLPRQSLERLLREARKENFHVVVDEAFFDFSDGGCSAMAGVGKNSRLIVLRSLTKIYAIAGLRLAYLAGPPKFVEKFNQTSEPWSLNTLAIAAGLYCLDQVDFIQESRAYLKRLKSQFYDLLNKYFHLYPTDVNYVLAHTKDKVGDLVDFLFDKGILVRDASDMHGLSPGFLRLAIKPSAQIKRLVAAMEDYSAGTT
ncbi:MAG: histidinol-phosphate aminotransferase family protein, partial [Deltaproteobacteria bacterium]|nr:histidinol-phosphate aminotransferase family protein [Deltaproteobacteria bacterium]